MSKISKLSTESYKGVRDFYPEDLFVQNYIFNKWREIAEKFGYLEYNASVLEPAELYKAKTGEEIVNEQTYTFTDRGEREVTLRPEMTPTIARMVAGQHHNLTFPLRWYSIPNLFRYEKPQRGRLREHWQLNVDIFGVNSIQADIEIISIADQILRNFGAKSSDFVIKVNSRKIINNLYKRFDLNEDDSHKISKIIDKKEKISSGAFDGAIGEILKEKSGEFISLLESAEKLLEFFGENDTKKRRFHLEHLTEQ
jgi:histidyl-tRNA synthetase